ncbi:MAG: glycoside hydrolase family 3 C-terminal domain-containing protein, partial [Anaerolineales bacterium]|nr:glycoside hydrolase family 3 C-terminal domain-containing protein [Anaerolineales bacterium]
MEERIQELISQMTLAEKASMLAGADMWRTVPIERLGIPSIQVTDGPNGARGADDNIGATSVCVPCGIALGATWNPELVEEVSGLLAKEVHAKGAHVLLAPTVNIHRTPIAGRNFECYAEDPFLSGRIASAYVNGLQAQKVGACIKHFVCNDQEHLRFMMSSDVTERPLNEIYLEPFRMAIENANPWSIMSGYNRVNGVYASENEVILRDILKGRWAYDGAVVSDWYGTYSDNVPAGGLDLEMPGPARYMDVEKIVAAVQAGELAEAVIDDKVERLLRLISRVGGFEEIERPLVNTSADQQLARQAATEALVLLKNDGDLLPLDPDKPQKIVLIGENANAVQIMGGGSAQVNPHYIVSPLKAMKARVGEHSSVDYHIGTALHRMPPMIDLDWMMAADEESAGLTLEYFHNLELAGEPSHVEVVRKTQLSWFGTVNPYVDPANFSMRLTGSLTVPEDGAYTLHLWSIGRARLFIDGEVVVDHWETAAEQTAAGEQVGITVGSDQQTAVPLNLEAGKPVSLVVEYITSPESRWRTLRLGCVPPLPDDPMQVAVDAAAAADVAIVVAGLTYEWEGEGDDRPDMELVRNQNELISRVAAVNPNTIVVLNVGSPVTMPWVDDVSAILQAWYAGQEIGHAISDVVFGDAVPSGKLPITFPKRLADNPAYINYPGENGHVLYG